MGAWRFAAAIRVPPDGRSPVLQKSSEKSGLFWIWASKLWLEYMAFTAQSEKLGELKKESGLES